MHYPQRYTHPTRQVIREKFFEEAGGTNDTDYALWHSAMSLKLRRVHGIVTTQGSVGNGFDVMVDGEEVGTLVLDDTAAGEVVTVEIDHDAKPFDEIKLNSNGTVEAHIIYEYRHIENIDDEWTDTEDRI